MKLKSDWRHLACNQIKNKIRMRTRWPPRWQFITKNMRKSSLKLVKIQGFAFKMLICLILELHYRCNIQVMLFMHHSEFDIFKMAPWKVADKFYKPLKQHPTCRHVWLICNGPDALSDRAAIYKHAYLNKWTQHACLIELHCTSRHIWEQHRISRHVWYNATTVQVAPNSIRLSSALD